MEDMDWKRVVWFCKRKAIRSEHIHGMNAFWLVNGTTPVWAEKKHLFWAEASRTVSIATRLAVFTDAKHTPHI